jgi:cytochrome c-type biogenesis protein CcmF
MIIELGHFALWLALAAALVQAIVPLWGTRSGSAAAMRVADTAAQVQFLGVAGAFAALTWA